MDKEMLFKAASQTVYMTVYSMVFIVLLGFAIGIVLFNTSLSGMRPNKKIYSVLSLVVNLFRSIPFAVLIVLLAPSITRFLIGTMLGTKAILPALVLTGAPFFARTVENSLNEIDPGLIEVGQAMGASKKQIMFKILLKEARSSLVSAMTLTAISIISYTSMAGIVGGGGLGYVAIQYGLYRNNMPMAYVATSIILVFVFIVQTSGVYISNKLNRK